MRIKADIPPFVIAILVNEDVDTYPPEILELLAQMDPHDYRATDKQRGALLTDMPPELLPFIRIDNRIGQRVTLTTGDHPGEYMVVGVHPLDNSAARAYPPERFGEDYANHNVPHGVIPDELDNRELFYVALQPIY